MLVKLNGKKLKRGLLVQVKLSEEEPVLGGLWVWWKQSCMGKPLRWEQEYFKWV